MTAPPVAVLIWSKTDCKVSVEAMVMVWPLTVNVPAVTGLAKPALPSTTPETSSVELSGLAVAAAPLQEHRWPVCEILKV